MYTCRSCDGPTDERAWSIFARVKICPACSAREKAEGFWWGQKALADALWLRAGVEEKIAEAPPPPDEDIDWWALSNGITTVMPDGTLVKGEDCE